MTAWFEEVPADSHWLITGATRRGKSGLLELRLRALIRRAIEGATAIDPHGGFVRAVFEWSLNPANGVSDRAVHFLDPASRSAFGLNPLQTYDDSWEACHDAAITLASVVESRFGASPEETPLLARLVYVAGMLCARHKLGLLELIELLSMGGHALRQSLLADFENRVVRRELEDLHSLAEKSTREFLSVVQSCKNCFVRWLGDPRLARLLGQTKNGLDPRAIMDGRRNVLVDLSSLTYQDASFVGTLFTSMYFAAARRRPPLRCARHRLILDEAESLITIDVARAVDQSAKYGLCIDAAIQRLGQVRAKDEFIADALFGNCAVKVCFGGLEPLSARYMAELLYTGHLNLCEWKELSLRPVSVGSDKTTVANWSRAEMSSESEARASARSRAHGAGHGIVSATSTSRGSGIGSGESYGQVLTPPIQLLGPSAPDASFIPTPLSQNTGESSSLNSFEQTSQSSGETYSEFVLDSQSHAETRGTSRGSSRSEGGSEVFNTRYEWLPSQLHSLEEQLHRCVGQLMSLPRRECVVKIEDRAPFRTRTADLTPAFKSLHFKSLMLPRYLKQRALRNPYIRSADAVDAEIAARFAPELPKPEKPEPKTWREPFDYPDPPPPPDAPRGKPKLRVVRPNPVKK